MQCVGLEMSPTESYAERMSNLEPIKSTSTPTRTVNSIVFQKLQSSFRKFAEENVYGLTLDRLYGRTGAILKTTAIFMIYEKGSDSRLNPMLA